MQIAFVRATELGLSGGKCLGASAIPGGRVACAFSVASARELPTTTDRLETSANTGSGLAHARETTR